VANAALELFERPCVWALFWGFPGIAFSAPQNASSMPENQRSCIASLDADSSGDR
jgi:hypothetical protein